MPARSDFVAPTAPNSRMETAGVRVESVARTAGTSGPKTQMPAWVPDLHQQVSSDSWATSPRIPELVASIWAGSVAVHGGPLPAPTRGKQLTASLHTEFFATEDVVEKVLHMGRAEAHQAFGSFFT